MVHSWQTTDAVPGAPTGFEQGNGHPPATTAAVRWPGRKGFHISQHRFRGGAHVSAVPSDHLIVIQPRRVGWIKCRLGDSRLEHAAPDWNVTICPAGHLAEADTDDDVDLLMLSLPVESFSLAVMEGWDHSVTLKPVLSGVDTELIGLVGCAARQAHSLSPPEPLWWDRTTDLLIEKLLIRYSGSIEQHRPRQLARNQLRVVRDFVHENMSERLTVEMLASAVGLSRAHFTRGFTAAAGLTPHDYVMRVRLCRAHELLRMNSGAAAAAAEAGFADQSHLAAWTRRVFGATIGEMSADRPRAPSRESRRKTRPAAVLSG